MRTPLQITLIFIALIMCAPSSRAQITLPDLDSLTYPNIAERVGLEDTCLVQVRIESGKAIILRSHSNYEVFRTAVESYFSKVRFAINADCIDFKFKFLLANEYPRVMLKYDEEAQSVTLTEKKDRYMCILIIDTFSRPIHESAVGLERYPW